MNAVSSLLSNEIQRSSSSTSSAFFSSQGNEVDISPVDVTDGNHAGNVVPFIRHVVRGGRLSGKPHQSSNEKDKKNWCPVSQVPPSAKGLELPRIGNATVSTILAQDSDLGFAAFYRRSTRQDINSRRIGRQTVRRLRSPREHRFPRYVLSRAGYKTSRANAHSRLVRARDVRNSDLLALTIERVEGGI